MRLTPATVKLERQERKELRKGVVFVVASNLSTVFGGKVVCENQMERLGQLSCILIAF